MMSDSLGHQRIAMLAGCAVCAGVLVGCNTAPWYRKEADQVSYQAIRQAQQAALERTEPFTIERPADTLRRRLLLDQDLPHADPASLGPGDVTPIAQWPDKDYLRQASAEAPATQPWGKGRPLKLTLMDALQVAARNSREYQAQKEKVYQAALALDLERDAFRYTWSGSGQTKYIARLNQKEVVVDDRGNTDMQDIRGFEKNASLEMSKAFKNALTVTGLIGLDLVKLLTLDRTFSRGAFFDGTISVPLLRGADRLVVTEPLTQAERNVIYAIYEFERFKRVFAVNVAKEYLGVLVQLDQLQNAEQNYRRLIASARFVRRLADAGRLPGIQVDQARQDELRANNRWVLARAAYERRLDAFKVLLGLPTDAEIELDLAELERLDVRLAPVPASASAPAAGSPAVPADAPIELVPPSREEGGPFEMRDEDAIRMALDHRLDLRVALGKVDDAQRKVVVAADALKADLTLLGSASIGGRRALAQADLENANMRFNEGSYSALLDIDLPLERTAERNVYRNSLIAFEQAVRGVQELEDRIKLEIRDNLRALLEARETVRIQTQAVRVAENRVKSTNLFLQAGKAEVRDVLEAEEALISAQNALTAALVQYRVAELEMQRDLGTLQVDAEGLWHEFVPETGQADERSEIPLK